MMAVAEIYTFGNPDAISLISNSEVKSMNEMNISEGAKKLLTKIVDHEFENGYWEKQFAALTESEQECARSYFKELARHDLIRLIWIYGVPNEVYPTNEGYSWEKYYDENDNSTLILQNGSILPTDLFDDLPQNFQLLCKQINASYEHHLYDCTAVIMRKLLEMLVILLYQNKHMEESIKEESGYYFRLEKIINKAVQNATLALTPSTKRDMKLFKDLGNYSAHRIWYNAEIGDIEPHILKYRAVIEELIYKAGLKT